jgi:hypothetical protein
MSQDFTAIQTNTYTQTWIAELEADTERLMSKRQKLETRYYSNETGSLYGDWRGWIKRRRCNYLRFRIRRLDKAIGRKGDAVTQLKLNEVGRL